MRRFLTWVTAMGLILCFWTGPAVARKKSSKKPAVKTTSTGKGTKGTKKPSAPKTTWRNRQTAPTPERYREIQQALAAKGYLSADQVNGRWTDESADAMKRFQADQKLDATGKINSLSLIALGLGPKRGGEAEVKPAAPPSPGTDKPSQ